MALFETLVGLLLVSALLLPISRRLNAPYPTLLALAGACVAALPFAPQVGIEPHLALALFVAPAILNAAYDTSPRELRRHWVPLTALALFAVVLTSAAVAAVGWAAAGLPLAAAVALGAIVAPPDAAAAAAVLANLGLPRRAMTVLQGESLLNDAVALLIFGAAVALASGGALETVAPTLLLAAPGGVALGLGLAWGYLKLRPLWAGTLSATIIEFAGAFAVWLLAERLQVSPVLTMVAYAMAIARRGPTEQRARDRVHSFSVWTAAVFVLNVLAFLLMGLQARQILSRLQGPELAGALTTAGLVFLAAVAVRMIWVMGYRSLLTPFIGRPEGPAGDLRLRLLVSWCGMRGVLTLATAFSLPSSFPGRDVIVLSAFTVVLGTLVLQGATIGLLMRWLKVPVDDSLDQELKRGRAALAQAGLDALEGREGERAEQLRAALRLKLQSPSGGDELGLEATAAQRRALVALHASGALAEDAFQALQEELDWRELSVTPLPSREIAEG